MANIKESLQDLKKRMDALPRWRLEDFNDLVQADVKDLAAVAGSSHNTRKGVQTSAGLAGLAVADLDGYLVLGEAAFTVLSIVTIAKLNDSPKLKDITPEQAAAKGTPAQKLCASLKGAVTYAASENLKLPEL